MQIKVLVFPKLNDIPVMLVIKFVVILLAFFMQIIGVNHIIRSSEERIKLVGGEFIIFGGSMFPDPYIL